VVAAGLTAGTTATLTSAGTISEPAGGLITPGSLDVSAGSVSLPGPNAVDVVTGSSSGDFVFRNDRHDLTIGCVGSQPPTCGVQTTAGGNILLETTIGGNLVLNQTVSAGGGSLGLVSAGTITH